MQEVIANKSFKMAWTPEALAPYWTGGRMGGLFTEERTLFYDELTSSNVEAARLARQGAEEGTLVVADAQSGGKGRLGRVWTSPAGVNLYFSMVMRPKISPENAAQMTLLTGVAGHEAMQRLQVPGVSIKWPNDLMVGSRKLGGILTEMNVRSSGVRWVIIGVGLNVNLELDQVSREMRHRVTSIRALTGRLMDRVEVLGSFLESFAKWRYCFDIEGFTPVRRRWLEGAHELGRRVQVNLTHTRFSGRALDLDQDGFLLVERDNGQVSRVLAGDVALLDDAVDANH
ncbi:MAG: biotin--[acetyl-CoA-carboxylase] ligase [Magnetococcales bacterium]|nr:biotin--[acetyl-CoA-carboxylase] ligase [Magnetococcales bacterium]